LTRKYKCLYTRGEYIKMTKIENQDKIMVRLKKIKGQVEGIEKMIQKQRNCLEIVQQVTAARSALAKVGGALLAQDACRCETKKRPKDFEKIINNLVKNL